MNEQIKEFLTRGEIIEPRYYQCGCCDCYHPEQWNGDCREDANRFAPDELDEIHGGFGWIEVEQPE